MMKVIVLDGHPRDEELAEYVGDLLSEERSEQIEAHVFDCPACAARLQDAASFQMVLHEAAEALEHERVAPPPSRRHRLGRRVGAAGGLWAAAAALALVIMRPVGGDDSVPVVTIDDEPEGVSEDLRWSACDDDDPGCDTTLLASVDPLESVDPLSSWPDDPQVRAGFGDEWLEGEPCGSGEDGGPLVCPTNDEPFSG